METRENIKLTSPSGKAVEVKPYLTARERNELRRKMLEGVSVDASTGEAKLAELTGERFEVMEHSSIGAIVTSFEGSTDKILDRLLDSPAGDYDFVVAECSKIANFKPAK